MKQQIISVLNKLGIDYKEQKHPAVFTVAESKRVLREKVPVNNLLLQETGGGKLVLVVMSGDKRLNTRAVSQQFGLGRLEFAKAKVLKQVLGVEPGAVSLFSLIYSGARGVQVLLDEALLGADEVGFHPNDNTETLFISGSALKKILGYTGHKYLVRLL